MPTRFGSALALLALLGGATLFAACDPGHNITYVNATGGQVSLFDNDGRFEVSLAAGESFTFGVRRFYGQHVWEARDGNGGVVYHEALTWDQIKSNNWTVTIRGPAE